MSPTLPHFPALRSGKAYRSLDTIELGDYRSANPLAEVSQVNAGLIRRDLRRASERQAVLAAMPMAELLERCVDSSRIFLEDTLSMGSEGESQTPEEYIRCLSATSGMPHTLCKGNMQKVAGVMREMPNILRGLMRGMDPSVLDSGVGEHDGVAVRYTPTTNTLGAVLPSNSPGVHSLWIPAIVLKVPVILKPGREEPWTPMRIAQAMMAAGIPPEAFNLYPTDHEGSRAILEGCGRTLLFGAASTTDQYIGDDRVEVHGPGYSKLLIGPDEIENWRDHLDVLVQSVSANGGRSCVNASSIFVPAHAEEIAQALAERLNEIVPRSPTDPEAQLAAFADPARADGMNAAIESGLAGGTARDVTEALRGSPRRMDHEGAAFLLPTVIRCDSKEHPLAASEYLFPFCSVVEVPASELLDSLGPSLVVSAITRDPELCAGLRAAPSIQRLNLGPLSTASVQWDQPHEGNLFELLYTRRAYQSQLSW
ncbi:MAG: acyl-CoA reductase-like NAD-dependent aldehyde dehydrogenase [Candidatus Paceibacteria bacterium]|jgi:acyl-CoA reductase-like NAD-dependent aldehyde dehydrogenase